MSDHDPEPVPPPQPAAAPLEPTIYRPMLFETDASGRRVPQVGHEKNMLGVTLPPADRADVHPDPAGMVVPGNEGLSVAPDLKSLPLGLVPERLRSKRQGARGPDELRLFRLGEGLFQRSDIAQELELQPTSRKHGVVRPRAAMHVDQYQARLADTKPRWNDEG